MGGRFHLWGRFHPSGVNGSSKSTVLTAIRKALGPEYVGVAHEDLLVKASGKHDDIKAHIVDKRLVIAIETDESAQLDERLFKSLGGDVINARQLYEQSNDYKPVWKIVLATNHLPDIKNFDDAIRRRLLIVPTAETVPENQRVPYLKQLRRSGRDRGPFAGPSESLAGFWIVDVESERARLRSRHGSAMRPWRFASAWTRPRTTCLKLPGRSDGLRACTCVRASRGWWSTFDPKKFWDRGACRTLNSLFARNLLIVRSDPP
jgi:Family of unknown function (DUF5906)